MKKILVIGGTGTISSPIVERLSENREFKVIVLNRGNRNKGLPERVDSLTCDYNDTDSMKRVLDSYYDVVINFILFTPEQAKRDVELFTGRVGQYIFISTVASRNHELTCLIDEESLAGNRFGDYGKNKGLAEDVFTASDLPYTIVRPSQTYSEDRFPLSVKGKSYWPVIQRMIDGKEVIVHGDGQSVWASTHADEFAELFVSVVGHDASINEVYQIMNDTPHTWDDVYREFAKQLNVEYKPVYISKDILKKSRKYDLMTSVQGDKHFSNIYDVSKIKALNPGFEFKIGLKEGVEGFLNYCDANIDAKVYEPDFDAWCDALIASYKQALSTIEIQ